MPQDLDDDFFDTPIETDQPVSPLTKVEEDDDYFYQAPESLSIQ